MRNTWIVIGILVFLLIVGGVVYYFMFSETAEKKKLVDQIMTKYKGKTDADPKKLMAMDIKTLQGILDGSIH